MGNPRVLVACEFSGTVRDAFLRRGIFAMSCDLLPSETPGPHYQGDVRDLLDGWMPVQHAFDCDPDGDGWCGQTGGDPAECPCVGPTQDDVEYRMVGDVMLGRPFDAPNWDMIVAHPPCTYLSSSGLHWNKRVPGREQKTQDAVEFVRAIMEAPCRRVVLENPIGALSTRYRKPEQTIQPWMFGEDASKATCLWLKGLPKLQATDVLPGGKTARRANQTPSGQNKLGPSPDRWKIRSKTYLGIAEAIAEQYGKELA